MKPLFLKPVMAIFNNSHERTFSGEKKQYWVSPSLDFREEMAPDITYRVYIYLCVYIHICMCIYMYTASMH